MLKRLFASGLLVVFAWVSGGIGSANAAPEAGAICLRRNNAKICMVWGHVQPVGSAGGSGGGAVRLCTYDDPYGGPRPIACSTGGAVWNQAKQCHVKKMSPQPAFDDPDYVYFWQGRTTGAIWECWMGSMWKGKPYWADSPPDAPDAQAMAVQAMAQLRLSPIRVGMVPHPTEQSPDSIGLVGRSVWMWAESPDAGTVGPKSITVTDGPYSVGLNARVDKIVWDMGDGTQITCKGPGTVWTPTQAAGNRRSPTCGHVYEKQGPYTVTATTHWVVNWAALDQHGQFNFTLTSTVHVLLGELQVVSRHK